MMRESAYGVRCRGLLSSSLRGGADEDTNIFPVESASLPLLASLVPEGFPLGGEVAVTGRNTKEEGVIFLELVRGDERDGAGLAGGVHLREDFLREGLFDSMSGVPGQLGCFVHSGGVPASSGLSQCAWDWSRDALVDISLASCGFNAGFFCFGDLCDVAVHGILYHLSQ